MKAGPKPRIEEVPITRFKARCLSLVDDVRKGRREIVITMHGRPVARVIAEAPAREPAVAAWPVEGQGRDRG
ncbi:MAG: type II toxin-antitoxin system Phd/YefM family antitoxin [Deltaproteobacteria bacterium]|nr:type II toxin-antitoxin system Phd/YefM family antitoxin [Deltaproteobacteria bacterium]